MQDAGVPPVRTGGGRCVKRLSMLPALASGVASEKAFGRQFGRGRRRMRPESMGLHNEILEVLPRLEQVVDGQDVQVQEELAAAAEALTDQAVMPFGEFKDSVRQEGEDIEGCERVGQMFFSVPEIVLQVVTLGLERVVVAVLDAPAGASARDQFHGVQGIHVHVGHPAVAVGLPSLRVGHGQFDPCQARRAVLGGERDALREADCPCPLAPVVLPAGLPHGPDIAFLQEVDPLVRGLVGLPEAGEDEMQSV